MTISAEAILSHLQSQRQEMIDFLSDLVHAESPSQDIAAQAKPQAQLSEALTDLGFAVSHLPGPTSGGCLQASRPELAELPTQLLIGHCDTVWPVGTLETMPLEIRDETMHGPGVLDMKSGLTQIIFALKTIHALGLPLTVSPIVFVNSDEEVGSDDSTSYIEELAKTAERSFVIEPSAAGKLKTARKGTSRYTVEVAGVSAHAGLDPKKGASAILEMAYVVQKLSAIQDLEKGISVNVGTIQGGRQTNVIPDTCTAVLEMRGLTEAAMLQAEAKILAVQPTLPNTTVTVTGCIDRGPMEKTAAGAALWEKAKSLGQSIGLELEDVTVGGGSDGNTTSRFTATLDGLGPVGDGAHAIHEFIYIDSMVERCALLVLLLMEPAKAD